MRIPLVGGAYQARSVIASAQRCVNLYPESNPQDSQAPVPVTHYPTPGLVLKGRSTVSATRQTYRATNGDLYAVVGTDVFYVDNTFTFHMLGAIPFSQTPVSLSDNGLCIILVDGTTTGYAIDMTSRAFGVITDPSFLGADKVDFLDTFFLLNRPGTQQFYISLSNVTFAMLTSATGGVLSGSIAAPGTAYTDGAYPGVGLTGGTGSGATADITVSGGAVTIVTLDSIGTGYSQNDILSANAADIGGTGSGFGYSADLVATAFDPLDIASKTGSADPLVTLVCVHGEIFLIGSLTTEPWVNTGAADFTFGRLPGTFIEHGCAAKYSVAKQDTSAFWLSQDREGHAIVVKVEGYQATRISTHAIEATFQAYATIADAIGYCYQIDGHSFYVLTFPSANSTWAYELQTGQWHELAFLDANGNLNRHRANCCCFAYGLNIIGDWQNGGLYALDSATFTDDGAPILRVRSFPHLIKDGKRVTYQQFVADVQVGTLEEMPLITLRVSDDRGVTYWTPGTQPMGAQGDYLAQPSWWRLGMARDRVFELSWSASISTSLNGAFVETIDHGT